MIRSLVLLTTLLTASHSLHVTKVQTNDVPWSYFVGVWDCDGLMSGGTNPHHASLVGVTTPGRNGVELSETDLEPAGYSGTYQMFTDPHGQVFDVDVNNSGYAIYEGLWQHSLLTLTRSGAASYHLPKADRFIYRVLRQDAFEIEWQIDLESGWARSDILHCHRKAN